MARQKRLSPCREPADKEDRHQESASKFSGDLSWGRVGIPLPNPMQQSPKQEQYECRCRTLERRQLAAGREMQSSDVGERDRIEQRHLPLETLVDGTKLRVFLRRVLVAPNHMGIADGHPHARGDKRTALPIS